MFILALFIGCILGFALAVLVLSILVAKSNDHGDSKGTFKNFAQYPINVTAKKDNLNSPILFDFKRQR